ncbi:MAG: hypothetical protein ACRCZH_05455 [Cetobacterium sp.]
MITDEQRVRLGLDGIKLDFYFEVECSVIDDESVFGNVYESMLYIVLARYLDRSCVLPSTRELAKKCYCEEEVVVLAMEKLIEKNLMIKLEHGSIKLFSLKKVGG